MILQRSIHGATRNTYTNTVMAKNSVTEMKLLLLRFRIFLPMTVSKNTLIGIPIGVNNRLSLPEVEFSSYKMQNKKKMIIKRSKVIVKTETLRI